MKVLSAQVDRVSLQLLGENVDDSFDEVSGFCHAEGTAIGDAARGLVGVDTVDFTKGGGIVVGAGADAEEAGGKFGWLRGCVEGAMIGERLDAEAWILPSFVAASSAVMW